MKLGEAPGRRADLQKQIAQTSGRLQASAIVQAGDRPPEEPQQLLDVGAVRREIDGLARRQRELDTAIQEHNWTTDLIEDASR
jgi:hypothetical protein